MKTRQLKIKQFLCAFGLFIVLDYLWLGFVMKDFNLRQLSEIGRIENGIFQMNYWGAVFAYIFMTLAVVIYVLPRVFQSSKGSMRKLFLDGAIMGLIIYGVFDMTNLAIFKNYPLAFIFPDMIWGTFVFGFTSVATAKITLST